jgi:molybdopterin/thiamine biosynthesis adenylyltransferase/rhodanese-related sulfurtransferase
MKMNTNRYIRQIALPEIGITGQQKLSKARVLVIGAGGLGCPVLQNLAAAGVGTIGIVDGDVIDETNLHRQLLYTLSDCKKNKAEVATKAIKRLNEQINIVTYPVFLTKSNVNSIVSNYDIVVDCTDEIPIRYLINDCTLVINIPMVSASIHKFEGQLSVFNYQNGPSYRCLFPENTKNNVPNCSTSGVLGVLPNLLGTLQATEVLKIILEIGNILNGKLMIFNVLNNSVSTFNFKKNNEQIIIGTNSGNALLENRNVFTKIELEADAFLNKGNSNEIIIVDIRNEDELPKLKYSNIRAVPLNKLEVESSEWNKKADYVIVCQSGKRSSIALEMLINKGFESVSHLKNGIQSIV